MTGGVGKGHRIYQIDAVVGLLCRHGIQAHKRYRQQHSKKTEGLSWTFLTVNGTSALAQYPLEGAGGVSNQTLFLPAVSSSQEEQGKVVSGVRGDHSRRLRLEWYKKNISCYGSAA